MASLQLDEFQEFESRALPYYASWEVIERILRAGALVCVVLLLSGLGLAQKVVTREGHHSIHFLGTRPRVSSWGLCFRQRGPRFSYDPP